MEALLPLEEYEIKNHKSENVKWLQPPEGENTTKSNKAINIVIYLLRQRSLPAPQLDFVLKAKFDLTPDTLQER